MSIHRLGLAPNDELKAQCYFCVVMKKKYNHLSREKRDTIDHMLKQGESQNVIAKTIGVHRSIVSREISRNKTEKRQVYNYNTAQMHTNSAKSGGTESDYLPTP